MLKRQWTVPVLTLAFVVVGLVVASGCNKSSNPGAVSNVTAPTTSVSAVAPFSFAKPNDHKKISIPPGSQGCGFDPANYVEDDLTELVATTIKTGQGTSIVGSTANKQNHYRYSNYLGDPYGANAPDVTYQFTLQPEQLPTWVAFFTCGPGTYGTASFDHILKLIDGNCSNNEYWTSYEGCGGGTYVYQNFTQPGTYFIVIDGYYYAYDQGKFTLNICTIC